MEYENECVKKKRRRTSEKKTKRKNKFQLKVKRIRRTFSKVGGKYEVSTTMKKDRYKRKYYAFR